MKKGSFHDGRGGVLVPTTIDDLVDGSKDVDLKPYAKKADLDKKADKSELNNYATKEYVDAFIDEGELEDKINEVLDGMGDTVLKDYAKKDDLDAYAKKSELGDYAKKTDIDDALIGYAKSEDLDNYAEKSELDAVVNGLDAYAKKSDLDAYAKKTEIPDVSGFKDEDQIKAIVKSVLGEYEILHKVGNLDDFKAALANGEDIILKDNIEVDNQLNLTNDKEMKINLGGHKLFLPLNSNGGIIVNGGNLTIENGEVDATKVEGRVKSRAITVANGGKLTVGEGAKVNTVGADCALAVQGEGSEIVVNAGEIKAQEFGILATSHGKLEINGGKIIGVDNCPIGGNGSTGQGDIEIVMNGGELEANITSGGYVACGVYMPNSGTFTMNGGKIVANKGAGVVCRGGETILNGGEIITNGNAEGKVGDSTRVNIPCSAVVYDKNSKYPAQNTLHVVIGKDMILQSENGEDIKVFSEEENPNIEDNR